MRRERRRGNRRRKPHPHLRRPSLEALETRQLLAADPFGRNPLGPLDVSRDGLVSALDALRVINALGRQPGISADPALSLGNFIDVDGSGLGTALDALLIINALGRGQPILAATLPVDSAPAGRSELEFDLRTNQYSVDLRVSLGDLDGRQILFRIGDSMLLQDVTDRLIDDRIRLSENDIDQFFGGPLPDGDHLVEAKLSDQDVGVSFVLTVDRRGPTPTADFEDVIRVAPKQLAFQFDEPVSVNGGDADRLRIRIAGQQEFPATSVNAIGQNVEFSLPRRLSDATFDFTLQSGINDLAGNLSNAITAQFVVADPTGIESVSPAAGEQMVSLTREVIVRFDEPIDPLTVDPDPADPDDDAIVVLSGGQRVAGRIRVSSTERFATFFYDDPLPASTAVRVIVDGQQIIGRDGLLLDAEADNQPGGIRTTSFRTLPASLIPETEVFGFVKDSQTRQPIANVTISLDAHPQIRATTDENGFFELGIQDVDGDGASDGLPAPDFFVHIDGSTAVDGEGRRYAGLGKPFHSVPGQRTQLNMSGTPFDVFLPPISDDASVPIVPGQPTQFGFGQNDIAMLQTMFPEADEAMLRTMQVDLAADSAFDNYGQAATAAMVVPVDPDFLPAPLPPGLDPSLVVSIQTVGGTNFDVPASVTFPNLDGLAPGTQTLLFSFDHDAGRFVVNGTATVSEDGMSVVSDPGSGINAPGWHFILELIRLIGGGFGGGGFGGGCVGSFCEPTGEDEVATFEVGIIAQGRSPSIDAGVTVEVVIPGLIDFDHDPDAELPPETFGPSVLLDRTFTVDSDGLFARVLRRFTGSLDLLVLDAKLRGEVAVSASSGGITIKEGDTFFTFALPSAGLVNATATFTVGGAACRAGASVVPGLSLLCGRGIELDVGQFPPALNSLGLLRFPLPDDDGDGQPDPATEDFNGMVSFTSGFFVEVDFGSLEVTGFLRELSGDAAVLGAAGGEEVELLSADATSQATDVYSTTRSLSEDPRAYYRIFPAGGLEVFGQTLPDGSFETNLLPNTDFTAFIYHPATNTSRVQTGRTSSGGSSLVISTEREYFGGVDADADGIPDVGELTIGTDPERIDTDGDGISDDAELRQGLDPLGDRGFPTGVIASLPLAGQPHRVQTLRVGGEETGLTAFVAAGNGGLTIVDVSQFDRPILLSDFDLNAVATDLAVDPSLALAALATGRDGLPIVDVSDPLSPQLTRVVEVPVDHVDVDQGLAFAAGGDTLSIIDLVTGIVLGSDTLEAGASVRGIDHAAGILHVVDSQQRLLTYQIVAGGLQRIGQLPLPITPGGLFIGDDVAYVLAEQVSDSDLGGYATVDISDPTDPRLISGVDVPAEGAAGTAIALNGSGLGLLVGNLDRVVGDPAVIDVMDVSEPEQTFNRSGQFPLEQMPSDVAIAAGIGLVTTDDALLVVNYLPFDTQGQAPAIDLTIDSIALDADPQSDGVQLREGSPIPLSFRVTDDVQVRQVELLVDGRVTATDLSFPFDLSAFAPAIQDGSTSSVHVLQIRATDSGGNATLSDPFEFELLEETEPPSLDRFETNLIDIDPAAAGLQVLEQKPQTVRFEAIDNVGIDRVELLLNGNIVASVNRASGVLAFSTPALADGQPLSSNELNLRVIDRAGNQVQSAAISFDVVPDTFAVQLLRSNLMQGDQRLVGTTGVELVFDEPIDRTRITADQFSLRGPSGEEIGITGLRLINDDRIVRFLITPQQAGAHALIIDAPQITDLVGNALDSVPIEIDFTVVEAPRFLFSTPRLDIDAIADTFIKTDLNQDGIVDLVITTRDQELAVRLGRGGGKFEAESRISLDGRVFDVAAGDLNGDGIVDLAVPLIDLDQVAVLLQSDEGTFESTLLLNVDETPFQVEVVDLNSDGRLDILTFTGDTSDASVLLSDPQGGFDPPVTTTLNRSVLSRLVDDFNGDAVPDLAIGGTNKISIRPGDGAGGFGDPIDLDVTSDFFDTLLASTDLNDDGNTDLVVSRQASDGFDILLGDGTGGFADRLLAIGDTRVTAVAPLNHDGDAIVDLAVTLPNSDELLILRGNGDGTFTEAARYRGDVPSALVTHDFDRDGLDDVATLDRGEAISFAYASLPQPPRFAVSERLTSIVEGDFNGDGRLDVVATSGTVPTADVAVLLATDTGFADPISLPGVSGRFARVADTNGDGFLDVIALVSNTSDIQVVLGNGDGTFEQAMVTNVSAGRNGNFAVGDFNSDQIPDLAITLFDSNRVGIFMGTGDGRFAADQFLIPGAASLTIGVRTLLVSDLNGDGFEDIAGLARDRAYLFFGDGEGEFSTSNLLNLSQVSRSLVAADFDADGLVDLAVSRSTDAAILRGIGGGSFAVPEAIDVTVNGEIVAADFDRDGKIDLVVEQSVYNVAFLPGRGDGTFSEPQLFGAYLAPSDLVVADFDNDGWLDLLTASLLNGDITLLRNQLNGPDAQT